MFLERHGRSREAGGGEREGKTKKYEKNEKMKNEKMKKISKNEKLKK